jgi:hypothetical protein
VYLGPWLGHHDNLRYQAIAGSVSVLVIMILSLFLSGLELITLGFIFYQSLCSGVAYFTVKQKEAI